MQSYGIVLFIGLFSLMGYCESAEKASLNPEQSGKLIQYAMQCLADTGVSPDALVQLRNGKISEDEAFQKFIYCIFKKVGVVNKTGHVKVEKALEKFPSHDKKDEVKKVLEECNGENGSTPVETTFKVFKCFHSKTPVHLGV